MGWGAKKNPTVRRGFEEVIRNCQFYFANVKKPRCTLRNLDDSPLVFISREIAAFIVACGVLPSVFQ
jgi:hypothetical protein